MSKFEKLEHDVAEVVLQNLIDFSKSDDKYETIHLREGEKVVDLRVKEIVDDRGMYVITNTVYILTTVSPSVGAETAIIQKNQIYDKIQSMPAETRMSFVYGDLGMFKAIREVDLRGLEALYGSK